MEWYGQAIKTPVEMGRWKVMRMKRMWKVAKLMDKMKGNMAIKIQRKTVFKDTEGKHDVNQKILLIF